MHSTTTSRQKRPSRGKTRGSVKRSIIISALLFVTMLAVLGVAGSRFLSPSSKAHASGITTEQCHEDRNSTLLGSATRYEVGYDGYTVVGPSFMTVDLYYCAAYNSYFGRFTYKNSDWLDIGVARGTCVMQSELDNGDGTFGPVLTQDSGCQQAWDVLQDNQHTDIRLSEDTSTPSRWRACWTSTDGFKQTVCTDFFEAPPKPIMLS